MDKTTKAFVIGACSVVIAIPVIWIGSQVNNEIQRAGEQRRQDSVMAEMNRRSARGEPCTDRLFRDDPLEEKNDPELGPAWIAACVQSRLPVEEFE